VQKTVEPYWRLTNQVQLGYDIGKKTRLGASVRYNYENIQNSIAVQNGGNVTYSEGKEVNKDLNINPTITHRFNDQIKTSFRGYASIFESVQDLNVKDQQNSYYDYFKQEFYRIENQTDFAFSDAILLTGGGGLAQEYVSSNRYDSLSTRRKNKIGYFFLQAEWKPLKNLLIIPGIRYDANKAYASVWSPKLAAQFKASEKIRINASFGKGFKAPDFRQLYLNFTNVAAGSYSVFGSLVAVDEVNRLQGQGQIDQVLPAFYQLTDLKPETSAGLNVGLVYSPTPGISGKVNLFRNDIDNLIITDVIAYKTNGGQIYSYLNVNKALTQGFEANLAWQVHKLLNISGGYQFLITADKEVLDAIEEGTVYKRDIQTGISSKLSRSDYAGLPNRSKHMANVKLFFESESKKWFATTRMLYRSRWGTFDIDGNGIINREDEFANGYAQVNVSGGRYFNNGISFMAGVDNVFNYKDEENLPGLPGYTWYFSVFYDFLRHKNSINHTN
jgi:outer membrane receptor for ferrienterochelin and colicins